jgi:hypothetical protein
MAGSDRRGAMGVTGWGRESRYPRIPEDIFFCARCTGAANALAASLPAIAPPPQPRQGFRLRNLLLLLAGAIAVAVLIVGLGIRQSFDTVIRQGAQEGIRQARQSDEAKAINEVMRQDNEIASVVKTALDQTKVHNGADSTRSPP